MYTIAIMSYIIDHLCRLEWGYVDDELPTVGPVRQTSHPPRAGGPDDVEATSNVSSDALRGGAAHYGNAGTQWTVTTGVAPGRARQDGGWGAAGGGGDVRMDDVEVSD